MNGEKLVAVILIIFCGIILLAVGYSVGKGSATEKQKTALDSGQSDQFAKTVKVMSSGVIRTIVALGKVSNIFARTITITNNGESIDVYVKEDAKIFSTSIISNQGGTTTSKQVKAEFSDIKIGDQASATIKILPDGNVEAVYVNIFPVFSKPK